MKIGNILSFLFALLIGATVGYVLRGNSVASPEADSTYQAKSRIAEPASRVKLVTTVVTNSIREVVTNTVAADPRQHRPDPKHFREEMERLRLEDPAKYAEHTNRMHQFRARMLKRAENKLETLASIDTSGWTKEQRANHEKYQSLIARREELMEILSPESNATDSEREAAMREMREIGKQMRQTAASERDTLLNTVVGNLGFQGEEATEIIDTVKTVFSTTQEHGGHQGPPPDGGPGAGGPGGQPPPR